MGRGRWTAAGLVGSVLAALVLAACAPSAERPGRAEIDVTAESPTQPATLAYGPTGGLDAYAHPGALVVAGRDNYDDPAFTEVADAGGTVLIYLDPIIDNAYGRYHELLLEESACGPAVGPWPGEPEANEWGDLNDFRPGSAVQGKLRCVLETMVEENPDMAGWFADDVGSRSWFPEIDWDSWDAEEQQAYRDGAIEIVRTFREVADEHGLVFVVNGTWGAGDLAEHGGGYPDMDRHGNALADGGFVENHDDGLEYFSDYACQGQWAEQSPVTRGEAMDFAVTRTEAGAQRYVDSGCFAYVQRHLTYDVTPPWSGFTDRGLPSGVVDERAGVDGRAAADQG